MGIPLSMVTQLLMVVESMSIAENTAEVDGGGIYADSRHLNYSGNITMANNTAQNGGGSTWTIINNTLNTNGHNFVKGNFALFQSGGMCW